MMTLVFVSRSQHGAIRKTRGILDRYARRVGEDTWITPMTKEGLSVLHGLLKRNSSRFMSVTCFQKKAGQLSYVWSVGAAADILSDGSVPVHEHALPPPEISRSTRLGCLINQAAGFAHDLGKASKDFQRKLSSMTPVADPIRHEWISYFLLKEIQNNPDVQWADAWDKAKNFLSGSFYSNPEGTIFGRGSSLNSLHTCLHFLVASHHRFPYQKKKIKSSLPSLSLDTFFSRDFKSGFLVEYAGNPGQELSKPLDLLKKMLTRLNKYEVSISDRLSEDEHHDFWFAMAMLTRPALILADHEVSSRVVGVAENIKASPDLIANTYQDNKDKSKKKGNQTLSWHLENVGITASDLFRQMSVFSPPGLSMGKRLSLLQRSRDENGPFYWQDRILNSLKDLDDRPTLLLNLAGTGWGKTRMNLRALAQLCPEEKAFRVASTLNLRSLTLQTIDSYRDEIGIGDEVAGVIGDKVAQKLHRSDKDENGNEIIKHLFDFEFEIDEDGNPFQTEYEVSSYKKIKAPEWLKHALSNKKMSSMEDVLMAPVLACTVDFLVAAGELPKQANQAIAMLRLSTSDLVIDEIDSYDPKALVSILRMVTISALAGRNVIASSATLSEPCALALKKAWEFGCGLRSSLKKVDGETFKGGRIVLFDHLSPPTVLDDFRQGFENVYVSHLNRMLDILKVSGKPAKVARIIPVPAPSTSTWINLIKENALAMHAENSQKMLVGGISKNFSVGLIRVANIKQAILVARKLSASTDENGNPNFKVCCYHSRLTRVHRHYLEKNLDQFLKRKLVDGVDPLLSDKRMVEYASSFKSNDARFVVVATPVEEIGRDHDFDWAIIEPSSTQSIIQTAGRVQRHRGVAPLSENIAILEVPYRICELREEGRSVKRESVFSRPGLDPGKHESFVANQEKILGKNKHQEGSMYDFLTMKHDRLVVDAGIKFERDESHKPKHLFSMLDNRSMQAELDKVHNMFSGGAKNERHLWFYSDIYREYCLRDKPDNMFDVDILLPMFPGDPVLMKYYDYQSKTDKTVDLDIQQIACSGNSWLVPNENEIGDIIKKNKLTRDTAMNIVVSVQRFPNSKSLRIHGSWGLEKCGP